MDEREGPMTPERLGLHKADCRAEGGCLGIPCVEGYLLITGPFPAWEFRLDATIIGEVEVLRLHQNDYSR